MPNVDNDEKLRSELKDLAIETLSTDLLLHCLRNIKEAVECIHIIDEMEEDATFLLEWISDRIEMNEINLHNNKELNIDNDDLDNEWNVPKITFSEISKVSKAISSEGNEEGLVDNDDFYTNNNNTNNIKIIKENINTKKNTQKKHENNYINNDLNTIANNGRHMKNIESKFSMDENCKTINLLSSQISNMDYLKQTLNNCLLKSGYKEVIDNSQKFMTKSSSLDFLNEYSNIKPESENIKKNLIMQMVLFTNMKNEMEILKKENDNLARIIIF
jgi:hypothetical protein